MSAAPARDTPQRILIVRLSHLGDVVHALPVYDALRASWPHAELAWAIQSESASLVDELPGIARVLRFERRAGFAAWLRMRSACESFRADWTIDVQGNAKSAMVTLCSGAPRRSGWHASDWREPFAAHVLTDPASPSGARHAVERVLHLARHVAVDPRAVPSSPRYLAAAHELSTARARLASAGDRGLVVIHLATPGDVRAWPGERFEALARALAQRGHAVLMLSGPAEAELGAELARRLIKTPIIEHLVGQRGLPALAALFTAAAERDARLVACDSGPMHLAAACGLRVVSLAGPQDALRTGPWPLVGRSTLHRAVTAAMPPPCAPCLARRCAHERGPVCMTDITVDDVVTALRASFAEEHPEVASCA